MSRRQNYVETFFRVRRRSKGQHEIKQIYSLFSFNEFLARTLLIFILKVAGAG